MTDRSGGHEPDAVSVSTSADRPRTDSVEGCPRCGEEFDRRDWHYPSVDRTADGDISIRLFCSEHCRALWEYRTRSTGDTTDP